MNFGGGVATPNYLPTEGVPLRGWGGGEAARGGGC